VVLAELQAKSAFLQHCQRQVFNIKNVYERVLMCHKNSQLEQIAEILGRTVSLTTTVRPKAGMVEDAWHMWPTESTCFAVEAFDISARDVQLASESFGIFSSRGIAAWLVAGAVAYVYVYVPSQRAEREEMVSHPVTSYVQYAFNCTQNMSSVPGNGRMGIVDVDRAEMI
jgi:hypothetical protein